MIMTDTMLEHIDRLIQQRPFCKDALLYYRELISLMSEIEIKPQSMVPEERLKDIKRKEGFPLFSRDDLPIDFEASSVLLKMFLEHLSKTEREDREGLKRALERSGTDPGWSDQLLKAVLKTDNKTLIKLGEKTDLASNALEFLARTAMKPSLSAIRNSVSDIRFEEEGWDYGYCPLCGSQPDMAYLDKIGKRYLHCELCGQEWPFPRLKCPFCQNEDHDTLGYFQSEQEEGFRVDFCRKCKRYIKTIDKRIFEETAPLELEFLSTIHLDILATEHGFK